MKHSLHRLCRQIYPIYKYPVFEGHRFRKQLYEDMLVYLEENPDATVREIKSVFAYKSDEKLDSGEHTKRPLLVFVVVAIILILCIYVYNVSDEWQPIITNLDNLM